MYSLTTGLLVLIPFRVHNLDDSQLSFLIFMGVLGYTTASIYLMTYFDNRKQDKHIRF
jgi:predicted cation transporter